MLEIAPTKQAAAWLESLSKALSAGDAQSAANLFVDDCYWRDLLSFTWNVTTMEGRDAIADMLRTTLATTKPRAWQITGEATEDEGTIEAWFTFETELAWGQGIMRLRGGRCRTLFTAMTDLKGFEERKGKARPLGVRHKADPQRETWTEARARETRELGASDQPYCLVIGGGQGGIMLGARLRQLGVPTIIIEKNARPGDSWRNRYRSLVLHDPVWYDHLPYIPFPENWPVFTPKDKMGDWLEMYTRVMELNYWVATKCLSASYDEAQKEWTVVVDRVGRHITLKPKHIVFATGAYGPPRQIDLPGLDQFKGELLHSSQYASGEKFRGKKVAVIGAASSGHDVSVDLWESGAEVTMIQRSPTTVVKSDTLMEVGFEIFSEDAVARGITTEKADMIVASTPFALVPEGQRALYEVIKARDAAFYDRLRASGFAIDFGHDETGLLMKAYRTGSGYYMDVGASDLIIDGQIAVRSGVAIASLTPTGILFEDGTELAADAIIACTGYQSMNETVAAVVSREVADKVGPCWGLGSGVKGDPGPWQGELRNMWRPTAQEALWFQGGNLALSRFYSKYVALQLKARMEGIETPVYGKPSNSEG
ncbi:NAD(P)/FAD-dependent oxidoreductase [Mesorhizobium sp. ES1-1]|uniref:NAD(P)/FAD-dependent oxidoreductase n=1 Tax=Mesorhizobium sp. ES1-1 TaxID=2876629 RepID=UPI001CCFD414|nr:NAD(P)/FAD-dependent oxidoreductase [Mesorhizobium sp. ES1-1]MBZ9675233.1 NAD(P)/FAD-dependent oxidoreductase [Mesorhizobium sp. ES1-1]